MLVVRRVRGHGRSTSLGKGPGRRLGAPMTLLIPVVDTESGR